jgi:hypothetical protein
LTAAVTAPEPIRFVAALARAVDLLRRSPEPGPQQKAALRALVAVAAERSATLRFYDGLLTLDGTEIPTADPRLAAFAERLTTQEVAEIAIAQGAGADELLALAFGLAADAGEGRIKERLRDAGSARVMVVLQQYGPPSTGSVTGAFEKQKFDRAVMEEWNAFLAHGAEAASGSLVGLTPPDAGAGRSARSDAAPRGGRPSAPALPVPPGPDAPAAAPSRLPRPSTLDVGSTPDSWFAAFESGVKKRFPDHFGDVDWGFRVDRGACTVSVGDPRSGSTFVLPLPPDYLDRSAWLLAGDLLTRLRTMAEKAGSLRRRKGRG